MKLITTLLLATIATTTLGQEKLSLADAIRLGLERNYDIRIEKQNVEVARNNNSLGEAGFLPSLTVNLDQNNNLTDNVETAFPTATQGQVITYSLRPSVNLNWTIFNGLRAHISKDRLEQLQRESMGNAEVVITNTVQAIILAYYKILVDEALLSELQRQLDLSRDKYRYTQIRKDIGTAIGTDLILEEGNYLTDSVNLINQQLTYKKDKRSLSVLMALDDLTKDYELMDDLTAVSIEDYEFASLLSKLEQSNDQLKKAYIGQAIAKQNIQLSRADRLPTVSLNAGYSDNRQRLDLSNASFFTGEGFASGPDQPLTSITDTYFINFSVAFTLFNGGRINRAIQNAVVQEDINNLRTDQLKTSLTRDLYDAYDNYEVRKVLFNINLRREETALTNLNVSDEKFKTGTINSFDYRTVQNLQLSAAIDKLQAMYNLIDAKVSILKLTGELVDEYVN